MFWVLKSLMTVNEKWILYNIMECKWLWSKWNEHFWIAKQWIILTGEEKPFHHDNDQEVSIMDAK